MFSDRLKKIRLQKGLTQQNMADKLGLSLNAYQKYESSLRYPPMDRLIEMADFFDVSLDYLLCRDDFIKSHGASSGE